IFVEVLAHFFAISLDSIHIVVIVDGYATNGNFSILINQTSKAFIFIANSILIFVYQLTFAATILCCPVIYCAWIIIVTRSTLERRTI
ncbi:MAG: hypothetical protein ACXAE3_17485, partial [Candidatus Kariarchaeaceae archaeon]